MTQTAPKHTNRLINETSPYLLQHAHNPVDWHPWGDEALEKARREDKPIFLSIGYAACHWCHVMEHESFENERVAEFLNQHYVSIKVDREQRPDLDDIYMTATQLMTGSGGWPMSVFLTPACKPFYAGTYFPPVDSYGRPGFMTLLQSIQQAWIRDRANVDNSATALTNAIAQSAAEATAAAEQNEALNPIVAERAAVGLASRFDDRWGGFGSAPKFPPSMGLNLLLREFKRTGDPRQLEMVERTLIKMAHGGMYDQLAGGFARYSTDSHWLVPHFEKMLYDNALLAPVYFDAWMVTGNEFYRRIGREILDYVLAEMTSPDGGFYSAQDADSEGIEGKYYLWTPNEVIETLGADDAAIFNAFYDVRPGGNWHEGGGGSILNVNVPLEEFAVKSQEDPANLRERLDAMRKKLLDVRRRRIPPLTDDKILAGWNGLMSTAMARGTQATGDEKYAQAGHRAADFILARMRAEDGGLLRSHRAGQSQVPAFLEDYAALTHALIDLYETQFDPALLDQASSLLDQLIARFTDPIAPGFFTTDGRDPSVLVRLKDFYDGATPSGNSLTAGALRRLALLLDRRDWRDLAIKVLQSVQPQMLEQSGAFQNMICVLWDELHNAPEIALVGPRENAATIGLLHAAWQTYAPGRVIAAEPAEAGESTQRLPLLENRIAINGLPTAYVCRNYACQSPVHTADDLRVQLAQLHRAE